MEADTDTKVSQLRCENRYRGYFVYGAGRLDGGAGSQKLTSLPVTGKNTGILGRLQKMNRLFSRKTPVFCSFSN